MKDIAKSIKNIFIKCRKAVASFFSGLFSGGGSSKGRSANRRRSSYVSQQTRPIARTTSGSAISSRGGKRNSKQGFDIKAMPKKAYKWLRSLEKPVFIGLCAGVAIVIAVPVVLACVLPGSPKQDEPVKDTSSVIEGFKPVEETAPSETPAPITPQTVDPATVNLNNGDTGELVPYVQERLMELGYLDDDITTDLYGPNTSEAVSYFQREHEMEVTGVLDASSFSLLFSDSALKYEIGKGIKGTDVEELQNRLYELGYIESVTGYYGTDTEAAVERFQQLNGISVDGRVGTQTLELLYSDEVKVNFLSYGASSEQVKKYQNRLKKLGYLTTTVDGTYGNDTVNAVKRFQERNGLIADGYLGPTSKNLLMSSDAQANALILGTKGSDVSNIQERLKELKYLKKVTGYYGSDTESAVRAFQKRNGLSQDGKVGTYTMSKLFSSSAKKAASSSSSSSSSGGSSSGGSSSGGSSSGSSSAKEPSTTVVANGANVSSLLAVAKSKLGCKYVRAGKGPNTFDCSGFVYWCLKEIGVNQGYMTSGTWAKNTKYPKVTSLADVQAGDIICFSGHVGIAMGGGMMIDAGSGAGCVRTTSLSLSYWKRNFKCAFRVL